ncbi:MAG: PAS domain-containing sensor histidine kinase [Flavobacteriales bacterium]|nr:MAG: PAS domain-containing sensor histidine kinase [Flavobacteriales bacterium]
MEAKNDLDDFLEHSLSGHVTTSVGGEMTSINTKLLKWLGYEQSELTGKRFNGLLAVGSRIFFETHLFPLLKLQGFFEEVSAELISKDGGRLQVLLNGYIRKDQEGNAREIRLTVYRATERKVYEENLRHAISDAEKKLAEERELAALREQFIAVLGHDLRNPLGAIKTGASLLSRADLSDRNKTIVKLINKSSLRMEELITNVMDFARVRLGGGISLDLEEVQVDPIIEQVTEELKIAFPDRTVTIVSSAKTMIKCDPNRIAQLLSNLVANALTHGQTDEPVTITAKADLKCFELAVANGGKPIPKEVLRTLFEPFKREATSPSQQGLGLGLYIASQIAGAHHGTLTAVSQEDKTCFTFRKPI